MSFEGLEPVRDFEAAPCGGLAPLSPTRSERMSPAADSPGESRELSIRFAPPAAGIYLDEWTLRTSPPYVGEPPKLQLRGICSDERLQARLSARCAPATALWPLHYVPRRRHTPPLRTRPMVYNTPPCPAQIGRAHV